VNALLDMGATKMANKYVEKKKVVYVMAENILKPLLNVVDGQMRQEYGQRVGETHLAEYKIIAKYFNDKSAIRVRENWIISKEMIYAGMAMIASSGNTAKAARQFRV
jgi:hypothetical protein